MQKVKILNKVPILVDGKVTTAVPGDEFDNLSDDVVAALIRGGDAEAVNNAPVKDHTPVEEVVTKKPSKFAKKNLGAAPENK